jgi:ATP-dependent Clp protease ATP-binding subunit ClpA
MTTLSTAVDKIQGLQAFLESKIRGQEHAVQRFCSILKRGQKGITRDNKPLGSCLFLGPTGVGKTELTLLASEYLFGPDHLFRFDMSEFLHLDQVKLFVGDESGNPGRLGRVLSSQGSGILLFDEIEKAHRQLWDLFLQMLSAARITLSNHQTYTLSRFYIIATSNIGSHHLLRPTRLPFATLQRVVLSELHQVFRPELVARFDETLVFQLLSAQTQREIARIAVTDELTRLKAKGFHLSLSEEAFEFLVRRGIHKTLGARPLLGTIEKFIGDAICESDAVQGILHPSPENDRLVIQ